ncbi:septum formation initiator family protein [Streptomyces sp. NPDC092296]|uniref:FtsB family cell division protein n=1 Tax=Streptomyces sp. NPDC092296 TaxID=3366012 RepID=UPI0037F6D901
MAIRKATLPARGPGTRRPASAPRPRTRFRFTGRAAVLALVLCSLIAALAYPTRQFIAQRADIAAQRAAAEQARTRVQELRREKARWQDPAFVRAQARERLHYAMPGDTPYVAVDPAAGRPGDPDDAAARGTSRQPWYTSVWESVDAADRTVRPARKPPAAPAR